ncbi:MAG: polyprenol monophosphomannose synthase, partial [Actinomycetales bacterium]
RLIVLPTYNEAENLSILIPRIFKHLPNTSVLVVDDGSPDGTAEIAKSLRNQFPKLEVLNQGFKGGLGSAYRAGFAWGLSRDFDELIEMDADMSHRVRDLAKLIEAKSKSGAQLVIGSRWISDGEILNWSKGRELLSRFANRYVRTLLDLRINDATSGFRVYDAQLLRDIDLSSIRSEGYTFQIEMTRAARKNGAKIVEVPIIFRERENGASKMSRAIVLEAIFLVTIWGLKRLIKVK